MRQEDLCDIPGHGRRSRFAPPSNVALVLGGLLAVSASGLASPRAPGTPERSQAEAAGGTRDVEMRAERILRAMGEYLAGAQQYNFRADIAYDADAGGQKLQYGGVARISVARPDRLHVAFNGDERQTRVVLDGQTFTVYNARANVYAVTEVPSPIDAAIDRAFELYGFSVPIADLVYSDPYRTLIENVQAGFVVGRHAVDGVPCDHLAFAQEAIDWQIWIEDGPRPVPRKLVITYKSEPGSPQYIARLSGWDFQPRISEDYFEFDPPAGSGEIEFLPVEVVPEEEVKP